MGLTYTRSHPISIVFIVILHRIFIYIFLYNRGETKGLLLLVLLLLLLLLLLYYYCYFYYYSTTTTTTSNNNNNNNNNNNKHLFVAIKHGNV